MDERVPQHIQNIVIRDYCNKNNYNYLLSGTEYAMKDSTLMLKKLVDSVSDIDGIVLYSLFQLPKNVDERNFFIEKILRNKKEFHFACEGLFINDLNSAKRIANIWKVKQVLKFCPKKI